MTEREEFDRWHLNKYGWMDKHAFETAEAAQRYEVWLSAKESSRKELDMHINNEVKLTAEIEALEKKLAEQQALISKLQYSAVIIEENHGGYRTVRCVVCGESGWEDQMTHLDNCAACKDTDTEELTKREAVARQQGFYDCFAAWGESRRKDLEDAKQAGRDEALTELSEQEPFGYIINGVDGKPWLHTLTRGDCELGDSDIKNGFTITKLIPRPNKPVKE